MPIQVRGVVWVGTRTHAFDESVRFFRDVLGIPLIEPRSGFAWAAMPDTSQLEVFNGDDEGHLHFSTGPVAEFLVDDLTAALAELRSAGVEILGEPAIRENDGWLHFRAPDGNVYGLTNGPQYRR
jgi:catechol 2,3-dioxygenase-like lactoylglutathione lyase family enzyme